MNTTQFCTRICSLLWERVKICILQSFQQSLSPVTNQNLWLHCFVFFLNIHHLPLGNTSAMSNQTARRISARLRELIISAAVSSNNDGQAVLAEIGALAALKLICSPLKPDLSLVQKIHSRIRKSERSNKHDGMTGDPAKVPSLSQRVKWKDTLK